MLADVTPAVSSYNEEIFGPVASLIKYSNIDEAIELANGTDFGLSACVFGNDNEENIKIAERLE